MTEKEAMEVLKQPCLCDYDLSKTVLDCDIKQCDKRDAVLQAIKALEEVQTYRAIGTPEECRAAVEKQKAKKPKLTIIKHGKHKWERDEKGYIDEFAFCHDNHNGVVCEVCGKTVCVHCDPNYDELIDCEEKYWNCPCCGKKIYSKSKFCDCGQKLY